MKAIDSWEAEGAIGAFNEELSQNQELSDSVDRANRQNRHIRSLLLTPAVLEPQLASETGSKRITPVLESGIAGISLKQRGEVKCLHAHTADYLCRQEDNLVGERVLQGLADRGLDTAGNGECKQQCDSACPKAEAGWWYMPRKNKQKVWSRQRRRNAERASRPPPLPHPATRRPQ